jgi:uncharacterized membrane protein
VLFIGYRLVSNGDRGAAAVAAVQAQRLRWMPVAARDNRMIDGIVLSGLSQGNVLRVDLGSPSAASSPWSGQTTQAFLERVPYVAKSSPMLEIKVVLLIAIFVYAFFVRLGLRTTRAS